MYVYVCTRVGQRLALAPRPLMSSIMLIIKFKLDLKMNVQSSKCCFNLYCAVHHETVSSFVSVHRVYSVISENISMSIYKL
jgi:hypothetical protein